MTPTDEILRLAIRLEGLSKSTALAITAQVNRLLSDVERELRIRDRTLNPGDVSSLLRLVAGTRHALADRVQSISRQHLDAIARASVVPLTTGLPRAQAKVLRATALAWLDSPASAFAGRDWMVWALKIVDDTTEGVRSWLERSLALGETGSDAAPALSPLRTKVAQAASTFASTSATHVSNAIRVEFGKPSRKIAAWLFVAVLDDRTSPMCRALSGNIWNDRKRATVPPIHPNCRSQLVPLTREELDALLEEGELVESRDGLARRLNEAVNAGVELEAKAGARTQARQLQAIARLNAPVLTFGFPANHRLATFDNFLKAQSDDFAREILGSSRFLAWKRGLPLGSMATVTRPLTNEELRRAYPDVFE